jgi:glutamyl-tRNA reductase
VAIASRTRPRADEVAARLGATAYALDELELALAASDIVIAATRAEVPVVTENAVRAAMSARDQPMVIVDLAVPADVERTAGAVPGVHLFDVDDLRAGLDEARASRLREVPKVEAIIEDEVVEFSRRYRELEVAPIVSALRRQAESLRQRELDRALGELGEIDPRVAEKIERLTRTLVTKLLHDPTVRLRERAGSTDGEQVVELVREFFGTSALESVESRVAVAGGEDSESAY